MYIAIYVVSYISFGEHGIESIAECHFQSHHKRLYDTQAGQLTKSSHWPSAENVSQVLAPALSFLQEVALHENWMKPVKSDQ